MSSRMRQDDSDPRRGRIRVFEDNYYAVAARCDARLDEIDEIDVPAFSVIGDSGRRPAAPTATGIARVDFRRSVPRRSAIGGALERQHYAAIPAHRPPA